ncbi:5-dehydro-4-deoxy-D-glucuronate isomerase [Puia dinghuensis]|uniref:4-deoxy-L-threo-5-hexosulose-uronate ketol-isomerase n=1 Tax=Puia dinghuensis TaxID=1792502 RepID=A0A8J2UCU4_9BACT|nr:5-dehydro-4-deoxy-D-glucuronate isomerase [Puia dinghuensis]GGA99609.1 4-deoxy-L-threo-5-hexosulose-uronate ketol-isomerase [Puia dinghuensis]
MEIRYEHSQKEVRGMTTGELRDAFLTERLMQDDAIRLVYTHYDRVILGGACPVHQKLSLETHPELRADFFLQRRELGIINVGGKGRVHADDIPYELNKLDCLYAGKGVKKIVFESEDADEPALFFLLSAPAHAAHPVQFLPKEKALPVTTGSAETSNARTIYKYIHAEGIRSCQLVMGLTILKTGSVWNTMPAHTHSRRMEAYFYFDVPEGQRVFHFMGHPQETRHLVVADCQGVVSPPWSIHSGCGTSNYSFIWGMAGENYTYTDMDLVNIPDLR